MRRCRYEDICNVQAKEFNGTKVRNLMHLKELVDSCTDEFMRFSLEYNVSLPAWPH